jgi:hypothetical protein
VPLTFRVSQDEKKWLDRIIQDLAAGKNVVVVSMLAKVLDRIRDRVMSHHALRLADTDILIHKALSGVETTALLKNVAENWKVRLLMYSPTVEAGVNFDKSLVPYQVPLHVQDEHDGSGGLAGNAAGAKNGERVDSLLRPVVHLRDARLCARNPGHATLHSGSAGEQIACGALLFQVTRLMWST